ncbi:hypothetical protein NIES4074_34570 [Cylindrospermum sp. NIES-4074]|nr:hypothetical protein NIES4074_34570 [Cylindrospermum sp. NIES-4074]
MKVTGVRQSKYCTSYEKGLPKGQKILFGICRKKALIAWASLAESFPSVFPLTGDSGRDGSGLS